MNKFSAFFFIMKKTPYILFFIFFALQLPAQKPYTYGLSLSYDFVDIKTLNNINGVIVTLQKPNYSSSLGGYLKRNLNENLSIRLDLGYQIMMYDYVISTHWKKYNEHNFYAMLTPQYRIFDNFNIGCGLMFNTAFDANNLIRPFARWAINPELQYQFKKWSLGARYARYVTPFYTLSKTSNSYWRTTSIFLTYQLGDF